MHLIQMNHDKDNKDKGKSLNFDDSKKEKLKRCPFDVTEEDYAKVIADNTNHMKPDREYVIACIGRGAAKPGKQGNSFTDYMPLGR